MRLTIISILLCFHCHAQTYLTSHAQKFLVYEYGQSVAITGVDVVATHHIGLQLVVGCVDGGTTYTAIGTPATLATNMPVFYPCIGSTFTAHSINFTQPGTYTAVDHGSTSNSSTGVVTNGTSNYWDTQFAMSAFSSVSALGGIFIYRTNNRQDNGVMIGAEGTNNCFVSCNFNQKYSNNNQYYNFLTSNGPGTSTAPDSSGYWATQRTTSGGTTKEYHNLWNKTSQTQTVASCSTNGIKIYIGSSNSSTGGTPNSYTALTFISAGILGVLTSDAQHNSICNMINYTKALYSGR
jgi:hypothetical protein